MAHNINILESGVVEIVHTGRMTILEATASRDEASRIMKDRSLRLIIADVSQTEHDETTTDLLEFNATHYEVFPFGCRIAVVIPSDPKKASSAQFAETVAFNRGIEMRVFLNREEAMNWLTKQGNA